MNAEQRIQDWRAEADRQDSLGRADQLIRRAGVQLLPAKRLLRELVKADSRYPTADVLQRLSATRLSSESRASVATAVESILARSDKVRTKEWRRLGPMLRGLLPLLTGKRALAAVRPLLNHRLRSRRDLAYSVFKWASIDKPSADLLLSEYGKSGEERVLKVLVTAKNSGLMADLLSLLPKFEDRYWRMRVLQGIITVGGSIPRKVVVEHPTEFVQAMARLKDRSRLPVARRLLRIPQLRADPRFVAFYAWAMFEMKEYGAVTALRSLLNRLERGT